MLSEIGHFTTSTIRFPSYVESKADFMKVEERLIPDKGTEGERV